MARSQRMEEVTATEQFVMSLANFAQIDQSILDNVDFDAVAVLTGNGRGVPQTIMRTAEEVKDLRDKRQKAMEEQQQQQQQAALMDKVANAGVKGLEAQMATGVMQ